MPATLGGAQALDFKLYNWSARLTLALTWYYSVGVHFALGLAPTENSSCFFLTFVYFTHEGDTSREMDPVQFLSKL
jgi:hypothetical protein